MAEFEAITIETQEQYDELIKERLTRHEKQIREEMTQKFADYDTVKASAAKYDEDKAAWEGEKGKLTGELNEKTKSLKVFELAALKDKAIAEADIPGESRDAAKALIKGETEEQLKESAEAVKKLLGTKQGKTPPRKDPELGGDESKVMKSFRDGLLKGE
jgi:hypothetical protein